MHGMTRYESALSWRYGSEEMHTIWSEETRRKLFRDLWIELAETQMELGEVSPEQLVDLKNNRDKRNPARVAEIEAETGHELMAELKHFAEQCSVGGGILHLGATSADILDNAEAIRIHRAQHHITLKLYKVAGLFAQVRADHEEVPCMGWTHLQPAEPTTVGYRIRQYEQDLQYDIDGIFDFKFQTKGFRGAVGTGASFAHLHRLDKQERAQFSEWVLQGIPEYVHIAEVSTQTGPRKMDYILISKLAGVGQTLHRFAMDLRMLQHLGEWREPYGTAQVGSSAMPYKQNPIFSENICSLARKLAQMPRIAWDNAANGILERTLDDSANRRMLLPESFLLVDEMLDKTTRILNGLVIDKGVIARNLAKYGPFVTCERVLLQQVQKGGDRQVLHEALREMATEAWQVVRMGGENPLKDLIMEHPLFTLSGSRLDELMDPTTFV